MTKKDKDYTKSDEEEEEPLVFDDEVTTRKNQKVRIRMSRGAAAGNSKKKRSTSTGIPNNKTPTKRAMIVNQADNDLVDREFADNNEASTTEEKKLIDSP